MSLQVGKWLGSVLTRLAVGTIPADGFYAVRPEERTKAQVSPQPERSRHFAAACEVPGVGQTQFVRGLC